MYMLLPLLLFPLIIWYNGINLSKIFKIKRKYIYWIIYLLVEILLVYSFTSTIRLIQFIGGSSIGLLLYYFMYNVIVDVLKLLPIKKLKEYLNKNMWDYIKIGLTLITVIFGLINATSVVVTDYTINTNKINEDLNIVMFSDIHLGDQIGLEKVEKVVKKINDLSADIVFFAGDMFNKYISDDDYTKKIMKEFSKIDTKYGVYAVLGNHDYIKDEKETNDFFEKSNMVLLEDESLTVNNLSIIGRKDARPISPRNLTRLAVEELIKDIDKEAFKIVIDHEPTDIDSMIDNNIDLVLSGHTHNGQIFPGNILTHLIYKTSYGHDKYENTNVVVSSGVGFWGPPLKIASKPEIVNIKLIKE